jgi:uncharacterized protein YhbP (UPF0306 family)
LIKEIAMTSTLADRVAAFLDRHTTLNLATTGSAGLWAAAVLYVHEGPQLYFTSEAHTRHGQNLLATGLAAGTINDDCPTWQAMKGLQLEGTVTAVDGVGERTRIAAAYLRRFPFAAALWHGETDPVRVGVDPGPTASSASPRPACTSWTTSTTRRGARRSRCRPRWWSRRR